MILFAMNAQDDFLSYQSVDIYCSLANLKLDIRSEYLFLVFNKRMTLVLANIVDDADGRVV